MIDFRCVRCNELLSVPESRIGQQEICPRCKTGHTVPLPGNAPISAFRPASPPQAAVLNAAPPPTPPRPQPQSLPQLLPLPQAVGQPRKPFVPCGAEKLAMALVWLIVIAGTVAACAWTIITVNAKADIVETVKGLLLIVAGTLVGVFLPLTIRSLLRSLRVIASTHQTLLSALPEELSRLRGEGNAEVYEIIMTDGPATTGGKPLTGQTPPRNPNDEVRMTRQ